jgi:hypothetical protein
MPHALHVLHIAAWGALSLCPEVTNAQVAQRTTRFAGWLTHDHRSLETQLKDCRDNKVFLIWQSKPAVDQLIATAKAQNLAYVVDKNWGTLIHVTIEGLQTSASPHCKKTAFIDGCVTVVKVLDIRRNNAGSVCLRR